MNPREATKFTKRINLYFNLIIAIPLLVFGYVYLEMESGRMKPFLDPTMTLNLDYIFPFLIILLGGIGYLVPSDKIRRIDRENDLPDKLKVYERIQLIRYGIYELAEWLAIGALYLTGNKLYGLFYVLLLVLFSVDRPTVRKISAQLGLNPDEEKLLENQ